jgi:hypothetical protein
MNREKKFPSLRRVVRDVTDVRGAEDAERWGGIGKLGDVDREGYIRKEGEESRSCVMTHHVCLKRHF